MNGTDCLNNSSRARLTGLTINNACLLSDRLKLSDLTDDIRLPFSLGEKSKLRAARGSCSNQSPSRAVSPNQVLTHAARAAAKQPFQAPLVAARERLWLE